MISAQGLTKYYGDACAIRDVSFEIASGEIVGILGLNGAGKTTTLRVLACLLLPSSGTVQVNGLDVAESAHEVRKLVGFLPENPPLYGEMTVESFLLFAGQLRGLGAQHARTRLEETLAVTEIEDVRRQAIASLSHGYRQRVGIAQAIIHDPQVLILDEPIQGLDPVQIVHMRELVRSLKGKHTILLSSHILSEISQTCDRILMVQRGELVAAGTEQQLSDRFSGAHRLRLVVRGERDQVVALVGGVDGVGDCQPGTPQRAGAPEAGAGIVELEVTARDDIREKLSAAIVQRGFGLLELSPAAAELESAFLSLAHQTAEQLASASTPQDADEEPSTQQREEA